MEPVSGPIAVLGGGSWGTALAQLLVHAGHETTLFLRDAHLAQAIQDTHENRRYLPGVPLHPALQTAVFPNASCEALARLAQARVLVLSVPCQVLRGTLASVRGLLAPECVLINTAKGIEVSGLVTPWQIAAEVLPQQPYAVLSGPSFAREVAACKPTAVVLGCKDEFLGAELREVFATPWFRSYSSTDVSGVELGGAVKNVIALAAGLSDGLGFGLNARAALVTRGLAETSRLGLALGARPATLMGLSGLGDLMLTCSGDLSRNRQVGLRLGQGESLDAITQSMHMVAEGVKTTEALCTLSSRLGVAMPVTSAMYDVLYRGVPARDAVQSLMSRQLKEE